MREYFDNNDERRRSDDGYNNGYDIVGLVVSCLHNWVWFVASIVFCVAVAWYTLQRETPIYKVTSSILLNDEKSTKESLESLGVVSSISTIDNELHVLRSSSIIRQTIEELDLYVSYYKLGRFRDTEI
ncbi:MAG: hypothetical protein R3Y68_07725, partial [Rikenellaceae bacterium]